MIAYKYRGGNQFFERDLDALCNNFFWTSSRTSLNDPSEGFINSQKIIDYIRKLEQDLGIRHESVINFKREWWNILRNRSSKGIFSLSKCNNNELLWAHYGASHQGFCIGYEMELLTKENYGVNSKSIDITYSDQIPTISLNDVRNYDEDNFLKKTLCNKSMAWSYEEEVRILTSKQGKIQHDKNAIQQILFGFRMTIKEKDEVMKRLRDRGIKYFQVSQRTPSYDLTIRPQKDIYET